MPTATDGQDRDLFQSARHCKSSSADVDHASQRQFTEVDSLSTSLSDAFLGIDGKCGGDARWSWNGQCIGAVERSSNSSAYVH